MNDYFAVIIVTVIILTKHIIITTGDAVW